MFEKKIDLLLFYESADRELDVLCALKVFCERDFNLTVEIAQHPIGELLTDLTRFRPTIVALPNVYNSKNYFAVDWADATYVNLRWEQIFYKGIASIKPLKGKFAIEQTIHHSWGIPWTRDLIQRGVPSEHIFTNGNLAYWLYQEPYRHYFPSREVLAHRNNLDPNKTWIFFPENYRWAFYEAERITGKANINETYLMRDFCFESSKYIAKWFTSFLAEHDQVEFIFRPRPATPSEKFTSLFLETVKNIPPHFHITKSESVREWILASDIILSSFSTSLIEAAIASKPAAIFEPLLTPDLIKMDWHSLLPHIQTLHSLQDSLHCLSAKSSAPLAKWATETMMTQGDAIYNLAKFLSQLAYDPKQWVKVTPAALELVPAPLVASWALPTYHNIQRKIGRYYRQYVSPITVPTIHQKDILSSEQINQRVKSWQTLLNNYCPN